MHFLWINFSNEEEHSRASTGRQKEEVVTGQIFQYFISVSKPSKLSATK